MNIRPWLHLLANLLPKDRCRVIMDRAGVSPYLSRWYLFGARPTCNEHGNVIADAPYASFNILLHRFHQGDDDTALHNHPWQWSVSFVLAGGYWEERRMPDDSVVMRDVQPGDVNLILDSTFHRVDLHEDDAWTLFVTGPKVASWGFWDRMTKIYTPWRTFIFQLRNPSVDP